MSKNLLFSFGLLLTFCILFSCGQSENHRNILGNWELIDGKKNNISTAFLNGTWLVINTEGCKSNLFVDKLSYHPCSIKDGILNVATGDDFVIKALTDSTLILEIIKSRNLFRLEMEKVEE